MDCLLRDDNLCLTKTMNILTNARTSVQRSVTRISKHGFTLINQHGLTRIKKGIFLSVVCCQPYSSFFNTLRSLSKG